MKTLALLRHYLLPGVEMVENLEKFWDLLHQGGVDVVLVDFFFFEETKDIKEYFDGVVIYVDEQFQELPCKRALESGDYYFMYHESTRIYYQLQYLKNRLFGKRVFRFKDLYFDRENRRLFIKNKERTLSKTEAELLVRLTRGDLVTFDELIEDKVVASRESLKVLIYRLRKVGFSIESVKNLGYRLKKE